MEGKINKYFFQQLEGKRKKEEGEMEGKINKYFFSPFLYLSHVWMTSWVGWDCMWMGY